MAQPENYMTCSDCIAIFKDAAAVLSSESAIEARSPFNTSYRTRLAANVSSSKCYMCILLHASIPRLLDDFGPEQSVALRIIRASRDQGAVTVSLLGSDREDSLAEINYTGSVRIQDGEKVAY